MPKGPTGHYGKAQATPQLNAKIALEVPIPPEKRNKVPEIDAADLWWYVCTTAPQQEIRAADSLRAASVRSGDDLVNPFHAYVPCEFYWKRPMRANLRMPRREFQRPALRHYIFVAVEGAITDDMLAVMRERNSEDRNRHGLLAILGSTMRGPLPMSGIGLNWLKQTAEDEKAGRADITPVAPFTAGENVTLNEGPFRQFPTMVKFIDAANEEVVVELSLMGSRTEIRVPYTSVDKAA